jgi:acetyl esterase/lipase
MDHEGHAIAQWLNKEGIAGFVLKYRHAPYKHPIPLQDAQRAIRIVRTNASKYKVNPDKIGIIGSSAGGHLASTVSTHFEKGTPQAKDSHNRVGTRPNFAILLYPVISMKPGITHGGSRNNLLGNSPTNELETLLSNDLQVTSRTPPTFTIHATDDRAVPLKNSELFHTALNKAKVPNKLMVIKKGGHGFGLGRKGKESGTWPPVCEKWLTKILANL